MFSLHCIPCTISSKLKSCICAKQCQVKTLKSGLSALHPGAYFHTEIYAVPTLPGRSRVLVGGFITPKGATGGSLIELLLNPKRLGQALFMALRRITPVWQLHLVSNKLFDQVIYMLQYAFGRS